MVYNESTVNKHRNTVMKECPFCESGNVDLYIAGEYQETIQCSECDGKGNMTDSEHEKAQSGIDELNRAMADEQFRY